jgi:acyl-CoA synthetase (AMP-forming)/AMP-acid ligase II
MARPFTLADVFEVVAASCPDRLSLVAGETRLTYGELDARANRVGHALLDAGLQAGEHVALLSWNRAEWIESMLGAYKARLVPINVNYRYTADELRYILTDADAVGIVAERAFLPTLQQIRGQLPMLRLLVVLEDGTDVAAVPAPAEALEYEKALAGASADGFPLRSPDDRYILYTGGTTGMPKGVVWRQEDIFFAAIGGGNPYGPPIGAPEELAGKAANDPVVQVIIAPMMHGGGQWMYFITVCLAGTFVLWTGRHLDPAALLRMVEREGAHSLMVVGDAMARPIADEIERSTGSYDLSRLAVIGSGGAILSVAVKDKLRALLPNVVVNDSFGASETGANGSVQDHGGPAAGPRFTLAPHTAILDDDLHPVVPGSGVVAPATSRSATTTTTPRRQRRSWLTAQVAGGSCPVTSRAWKPMAPSRCWDAVRCPSTPAARRSSRKRSRLCSRRTRRCTTRLSSGSRMSASASGSPPW